MRLAAGKRDATAPDGVLLLENEPVLRRLMAQVLQESGIPVLKARDGRRGLQLAKEYKGAFGLVIADIGMPVMDGLEFARAFRLLFPDVPILFTTGHPDRYWSATLPNCDLLEKPFGPARFVEAVSTCSRILWVGLKSGKSFG